MPIYEVHGIGNAGNCIGLFAQHAHAPVTHINRFTYHNAN
jgi:hypothetical protein